MERQTEREMQQSQPAAHLIASVEQILADTFGTPIEVASTTTLQDGLRAQVFRFEIQARTQESSPFIPQTVIVKQAKGTEQPATPDKPAKWVETLLNEWASLQFLKAVRFPMAPRLYGGDSEQGLMVIEDLGSGTRLDEYLLGSDAQAAETALLEYARQQGRMHADAMIWHRDYQQRRQALGPLVAQSTSKEEQDRLVTTFKQSAELFEVAISTQVEQEMETMFNALFTPGPFHTFIQIDACPDNCLFTENGCYLLDFEGGEVGHALRSGTYGHVRFPTCWCAFDIPRDIVTRMDEAYRAELSKGCPEAEDDTLFNHGLVEACVYWMLWRNDFIPLPRLLEKDRHIIAASDRQRHILNMDVVATTCNDYGYMQHTGAVARAIAQRMRELWPEQSEVPLYPAFHIAQ